MHDTTLGWTLYLEDLERQAIRLRRRPVRRPGVAADLTSRPAIAALIAWLRAFAAAAPQSGHRAEAMAKRG